MGGEINPAFYQYSDSYTVASKIKDSENNVLVVPETSTKILSYFFRIKKVIWWESVDNYAKNVSLRFAVSSQHYSIVDKLKGIGRVLKYQKQHIELNQIKEIEFHFVQSEYARDFVGRYGVYDTFYVSDYLNDIYIEAAKTDFINKENIVCYNPSKGYGFTKKLIEASPRDIRFIPIVNMTNEQVVETMKKSKVYIDFGEHPGKDRIPREAASLGNCVITSLNGSAGFEKDVPILKKYKFERKIKNIQRILGCIQMCINDYDTIHRDFDDYRAMIINEKKQFENDVMNCFKMAD